MKFQMKICLDRIVPPRWNSSTRRNHTICYRPFDIIVNFKIIVRFKSCCNKASLPFTPLLLNTKLFFLWGKSVWVTHSTVQSTQNFQEFAQNIENCLRKIKNLCILTFFLLLFLRDAHKLCDFRCDFCTFSCATFPKLKFWPHKIISQSVGVSVNRYKQ